MISAAAAAAAPKPSSSTPVFSLPPPCSYEELYSSYQNEWDQQKKNNVGNSDVLGKKIACDLDIDTSVSGLDWVTLKSVDGEKSDVYLLACTGSGEVLVWKLVQSTQTQVKSDEGDTTAGNTDAAMLLKKHARCKISHESEMTDGMDWDENDESNNNALHGICLVEIPSNGKRDKSVSNIQRGRKRQRPRDVHEKQEQLLLIVAGEGGLWSIPLLDVLEQPWEESVSPPTTKSQELPSSLVRLSNRPILKIQLLESNPGSEAEEPHRLCALERDTNTIAIWNLSSVLHKHATTSNEIDPAPDTKIDLSRVFSGNFTNTLKSKKRRKIQSNVGRKEHATTMFIPPSPIDDKDSTKSGPIFLIGTNQSKLWIVSLQSYNALAIGPGPRFLSLHEERESSPEESPTNSSRGRSKSDPPSIWSVTDILATNGGTWWTVAAVTATKRNSSKSNNNSGLLVSWHASTGMVVARQETREAIMAIAQDHQMYSAANEGAITVWDSSFRLKRRGRLWTSPPSSKALAILSESVGNESAKQTVMAVAGVGDRVDLFVNRCRVQTVRI